MELSNNHLTLSEEHWRGEEGDSWTDRNWNDKLISSKIALFARILEKTSGISSVMEFGPNKGQSLSAIITLLPDISCAGVELNRKAAKALKERIPSCSVIEGSILDFSIVDKYDLVFTSGLLIHIAERNLSDAYDSIYNSSKRYIALLEYYSPKPVEINYRGKTGILFKRDFAGEMLDRFHCLRLIDYGFVYHRDSNFPQDDINWFLLEK